MGSRTIGENGRKYIHITHLCETDVICNLYFKNPINSSAKILKFSKQILVCFYCLHDVIKNFFSRLVQRLNRLILGFTVLPFYMGIFVSQMFHF